MKTAYRTYYHDTTFYVSLLIWKALYLENKYPRTIYDTHLQLLSFEIYIGESEGITESKLSDMEI